MTVDELATIVMGELSWINMTLIGVVVIFIAAMIYMGYMLYKQRKLTDDALKEVNRLKMNLKSLR